MIIDVLKDVFIDNLKILPFLFLTFLLMEYIEDRMKESSRQKMKNAGKYGPFIGSVLGAIPQCGFSAAASNLYAGKVITMGTLVAIFLSTSDEMLPVMISYAVSPVLIAKILIIKIIYAMLAGMLIDVIIKKIIKAPEQKMDIHHFCEHEHCECGKGILGPAFKHTIKIFLFLLIISLVIGLIIEYAGLEFIADSFIGNKYIGPFICSLVGLIPNCGSSVFITAIYLENAISFGTMMSGLFTGSGVGILILFRVNEDKKNSFCIASLLYVIGVVGGILLNILI